MSKDFEQNANNTEPKEQAKPEILPVQTEMNCCEKVNFYKNAYPRTSLGCELLLDIFTGFFMLITLFYFFDDFTSFLNLIQKLYLFFNEKPWVFFIVILYYLIIVALYFFTSSCVIKLASSFLLLYFILQFMSISLRSSENVVLPNINTVDEIYLLLGLLVFIIFTLCLNFLHLNKIANKLNSLKVLKGQHQNNSETSFTYRRR